MGTCCADVYSGEDWFRAYIGEMARYLIAVALVCTRISFGQDRKEPITVKLLDVPKRESYFSWNRALELAVPASLGSGLTVLGVFLTTRANAKQNELNRRITVEQIRMKAKYELQQARVDAAIGTSSDVEHQLNRFRVKWNRSMEKDIDPETRANRKIAVQSAQDSLDDSFRAVNLAYGHVRWSLSPSFASDMAAWREHLLEAVRLRHKSQEIFAEKMKAVTQSQQLLIRSARIESERLEQEIFRQVF